jgi:hypothetical protein
MAMVHTDDIAQIAAEELLLQTTGVRYVISDLQTASAVASALGTAIQKPSLPWLPFTDEQLIGGMTQAGMPLEIAEMYAEMGRGMADGSIAADFFASGAEVAGKVRLEAFAKQFAEKYHG